MSKKVKTNTNTVAAQLPLVIKTGKYYVGFRQTISSLISESCKYIVLTKNYPILKKMQLEYYASLAGKVPVYMFDGSNRDLANLCGAEFRMGVISILDGGEADLLQCE
ncbi:large subunit ribosomal protein L30e [Nematocida homosporus]|uniref:large subunit ribosomal protein L30e n=1 Tax=Nematocida homosporus TaxID=1912981 RepID=UPI00221F308C|nr:large subunit ribosomal protein L30e [Nematocida homosporus]KAI5184276.1 large subunit ribosomal protein L30e [Nematocida homosporus]